MNRNNANELRRDFNKALSNLEAVQAHIRMRAFDLMARYPEVMVGDLTAQDVYNTMVLYLDTNNNPDDEFVMNKFTLIIEVIEQHIASQQVHVQTTLYPKL